MPADADKIASLISGLRILDDLLRRDTRATTREFDARQRHHLP